jgi:hypothetical protein
LNPTDKSILNRIRQLSAAERKSVEDYIDFLLSRQLTEISKVSTLPLDIPRPDSESVVRAMQRLTKNYPMLDTKHLFSEASSLMSQNVLQGRPAAQVINDLEALFLSYYQQYSSSPHQTK